MAEEYTVRVREVIVPRARYRYAGWVQVEGDAGRMFRLPMPAAAAQWLRPGAAYRLCLEDPPDHHFRQHPTRVRGRVGVLNGGRVLGTVHLRAVHGFYGGRVGGPL